MTDLIRLRHEGDDEEDVEEEIRRNVAKLRFRFKCNANEMLLQHAVFTGTTVPGYHYTKTREDWQDWVSVRLKDRYTKVRKETDKLLKTLHLRQRIVAQYRTVYEFMLQCSGKTNVELANEKNLVLQQMEAENQQLLQACTDGEQQLKCIKVASYKLQKMHQQITARRAKHIPHECVWQENLTAEIFRYDLMMFVIFDEDVSEYTNFSRIWINAKFQTLLMKLYGDLSHSEEERLLKWLEQVQASKDLAECFAKIKEDGSCYEELEKKMKKCMKILEWNEYKCSSTLDQLRESCGKDEAEEEDPAQESDDENREKEAAVDAHYFQTSINDLKDPFEVEFRKFQLKLLEVLEPIRFSRKTPAPPMVDRPKLVRNNYSEGLGMRQTKYNPYICRIKTLYHNYCQCDQCCNEETFQFRMQTRLKIQKEHHSVLVSMFDTHPTIIAHCAVYNKFKNDPDQCIDNLTDVKIALSMGNLTSDGTAKEKDTVFKPVYKKTDVHAKSIRNRVARSTAMVRWAVPAVVKSESKSNSKLSKCVNSSTKIVSPNCSELASFETESAPSKSSEPITSAAKKASSKTLESVTLAKKSAPLKTSEPDTPATESASSKRSESVSSDTKSASLKTSKVVTSAKTSASLKTLVPVSSVTESASSEILESVTSTSKEPEPVTSDTKNGPSNISEQVTSATRSESPNASEPVTSVTKCASSKTPESVISATKSESLDVSESVTSVTKTESMNVSEPITIDTKMASSNTSKSVTAVTKSASKSARAESLPHDTTTTTTTSTKIESVTLSKAVTLDSKRSSSNSSESVTSPNKSTSSKTTELVTSASQSTSSEESEPVTSDTKNASLNTSESVTLDTKSASSITSDSVTSVTKIESLNPSEPVTSDTKSTSSITSKSVSSDTKIAPSNTSKSVISVTKSESLNASEADTSNTKTVSSITSEPSTSDTKSAAAERASSKEPEPVTSGTKNGPSNISEPVTSATRSESLNASEPVTSDTEKVLSNTPEYATLDTKSASSNTSKSVTSATKSESLNASERFTSDSNSASSSTSESVISVTKSKSLNVLKLGTSTAKCETLDALAPVTSDSNSESLNTLEPVTSATKSESLNASEHVSSDSKSASSDTSESDISVTKSETLDALEPVTSDTKSEALNPSEPVPSYTMSASSNTSETETSVVDCETDFLRGSNEELPEVGDKTDSTAYEEEPSQAYNENHSDASYFSRNNEQQPSCDTEDSYPSDNDEQNGSIDGDAKSKYSDNSLYEFPDDSSSTDIENLAIGSHKDNSSPQIYVEGYADIDTFLQLVASVGEQKAAVAVGNKSSTIAEKESFIADNEEKGWIVSNSEVYSLTCVEDGLSRPESEYSGNDIDGSLLGHTLASDWEDIRRRNAELVKVDQDTDDSADEWIVIEKESTPMTANADNQMTIFIDSDVEDSDREFDIISF